LQRAYSENRGEYVLDEPGSIKHTLKTELLRSGLSDVSAHVFRHSRATHLLQDSVDPWAVAGLLGDTLKTVMATYGHHCPEHLRRAIEGADEGRIDRSDDS
jgi:site-specific recombinase XerD